MPGFIVEVFGNGNDYSSFSISRKSENNCLYFCATSVMQNYFLKACDIFFIYGMGN